MFGYNSQDLELLHRLNYGQDVLDLANPDHLRLLEQGLIVRVGQGFHAMPTTGFYEAHDFEATRGQMTSFNTLRVKGKEEAPGVRVEFGVDLESGRKTVIPPDAPIRVSIDVVASERGIVDEMEATHAPIPEDVAGCKFDTDGDGNCPIHPTGCPEATDVPETDFVNIQEPAEPQGFTSPEAPADPTPATFTADELADYADVLTTTGPIINCPPSEEDVVEYPDGIPDTDDTLQWERAIGDLPQAFESLRPAVRMLVKERLDDPLYLKIYAAAFQAKEVARTREFISLFNKELPARLNEKAATLNVWFEPWLNDLTRRVLTFDGSEEVQAAIRFLLKLCPDDRKKEVSEYLEENYINTGIARFFPEGVRRYKEASQRATIALPITWILKTAESINDQAEKEIKRPPQVDPALIEHAIDLMPAETDRVRAREKLMHRLAIGNGICMDEILTAWETHYGGTCMPALRYSTIHNWLKGEGKLYLQSKDAITFTAKEIIWNLLGFLQTPLEIPIGAQTWQESNACQMKWLAAASDDIQEHTVEGECIFAPIYDKFLDERWTPEHKAALNAK